MAGYTAPMTDLLVMLGRQPELSLAELVAVSGREPNTISQLTSDIALVKNVAHPTEWFARFGGLQKVSTVLTTIPASSLNEATLLDVLRPFVPEEQRLTFGVSVHGAGKVASTVNTYVRNLKKTLVAEGHSIRFLKAKNNVLTSVVVEKQLLSRNGVELLCVIHGSSVTIAQTLAVQDFEAFSERDYGRPGRNARSGMLPPKLARMMINLARVPEEGTVFDPFCGSGTILQEAAILGVENIIGSDNSDRAIKETEQNFTWLRENHGVEATPNVFQADILSLHSKLPARSIDAIVTEPFLGPPATGNETHDVFAKRAQELGTLYLRAFTAFHPLLKPHGTIVFLFPVFFVNAKPMFLQCLDPILLKGYKLVQPLTPDLVPAIKDRLTYRHTLLYRRPGQHIGREVLMFEKQ